MNKLFSILTASRNNCHYLPDWLDSILQQDYRPLEVVFVNDCSKDKTRLKIKDIESALKAKGIDLVFVDNPKRMYYSNSMRIANEKARGEFFGVLDSDDMLAKGSVEYIMELYNRHPNIGYIYTQFDIWDKNLNKFVKKGFSKSPKINLLEMGKRDIHAFSHWRTFSKRVPNYLSIWKPDLKCAVDKYMGYRLEELADGAFAGRSCYKYRWGVPNSISKTESSILTWRKIVKEAAHRRHKHKIQYYPIINL